MVPTMPHQQFVSLLLKVGCDKFCLLLAVRIPAVVSLKASILAPVIAKIIASVVVAPILKVDELHGAGVHPTLLQRLQLVCTLGMSHKVSLHVS